MGKYNYMATYSHEGGFGNCEVYLEKVTANNIREIEKYLSEKNKSKTIVLNLIPIESELDEEKNNPDWSNSERRDCSRCGALGVATLHDVNGEPKCEDCYE